MFRKKTTNNKKQSFKAFGHKRSKAQHLVEFVLFFPFLIGIIGFLTEIGYGLNTAIELNTALNRAVGAAAAVQRDENNSSIQTINSEIQTNAYNILVSRKVPYCDTLKVETLETDEFIISIATYSYTYAFKLVNLFFNAIPDEFHFKSIAISHKALFMPNDFSIQNTTLDNNFNNYYAQNTLIP